MKFRYAHYGPILRPVIPIRLTNAGVSLRYEVLVDSGADFCLFGEEVGTGLGIDVRSGKPEEVFGVGGKASIYYVHRIGVEVGGATYMISAGFMPNVAGRIFPYGVVGQRGFFEHFVVKFDLANEEIELTARDTN